MRLLWSIRRRGGAAHLERDARCVVVLLRRDLVPRPLDRPSHAHHLLRVAARLTLAAAPAVVGLRQVHPVGVPACGPHAVGAPGAGGAIVAARQARSGRVVRGVRVLRVGALDGLRRALDVAVDRIDQAERLRLVAAGPTRAGGPGVEGVARTAARAVAVVQRGAGEVGRARGDHVVPVGVRAVVRVDVAPLVSRLAPVGPVAQRVAGGVRAVRLQRRGVRRAVVEAEAGRVAVVRALDRDLGPAGCARLHALEQSERGELSLCRQGRRERERRKRER